MRCRYQGKDRIELNPFQEQEQGLKWSNEAFLSFQATHNTWKRMDGRKTCKSFVGADDHSATVTWRIVGTISTGVVTWLATTATDTTISREAVMDSTDKWWPDHDQQHCRCCRGRVRNIPLTYWLHPTSSSVVVAPKYC